MVPNDDDDVFRPRTPPSPVPSPLAISAPILSADSLVLKPTVYDPSSRTAAAIGSSAALTAQPADGLSAVQRNLEAEEAHRRLAEDADARASALRKAKDAVMAKLSREFNRRLGREAAARSGAAEGGLLAARLRENLMGGGCGYGYSPESLLSVVPDHRSMGSQSALVPLMFSRS